MKIIIIKYIDHDKSTNLQNTNFFIFKKDGNLEHMINCYLNKFEHWLIKLKFIMQAKKCSYSIFNNSNNKTKEYNFKLFGSNIPKNENPKFLGIIFDSKLSFNEYFKYIRKRCFDRLKIIKILSSKKWKLSKKVLINIYKSLIGSIIDYSALLVNLISNSLKDFISVTQNSAIRTIFNLDYYTNTNTLVLKAKEHNLQNIFLRAKELNTKYFTNAINENKKNKQ